MTNKRDGATEQSQLADWNDPKVQAVYAIICDAEMPPNQEEHWEGYMARKIVAKLFGYAADEIDRLRGLLAFSETTASPDRQCTCHPDDNPPVPCPRKFALAECRKAALTAPSTPQQNPAPQQVSSPDTTSRDNSGPAAAGFSPRTDAGVVWLKGPDGEPHPYVPVHVSVELERDLSAAVEAAHDLSVQKSQLKEELAECAGVADIEIRQRMKLERELAAETKEQERV